MTDIDAQHERVAEALLFVEDDSAVAQIADRFVIKYAPAVAEARSEQARARAWGALRHYLVARATRRKPWALTDEEADRALMVLAPLV